MKKELQEKIDLIKKIDNYNTRFIVKVLQSFKDKQEAFEEKKNSTSIVTKNIEINTTKKIIDLDKIWAKPYFYTKMRVRLEEIVNQIMHIDNEKILKNSSRLFKKAIYNKAVKKFEKPEDKIDIVDFINKLDSEKIYNDSDFIFIAEKIDEETLFKEEQLKIAIDILKIDDIKKRYSVIYDKLCDYLNKDFISYQYCDFKNNKCIAQRKHKIFPINRKNGCCFMEIRKCPHLINGNCKVQCIACKLFSCKYLEKRGIGYWAYEVILLKAFFNKEQRKHLLFDFYTPKDKVLKKVYEKHK